MALLWTGMNTMRNFCPRHQSLSWLGLDTQKCQIYWAAWICHWYFTFNVYVKEATGFDFLVKAPFYRGEGCHTQTKSNIIQRQLVNNIVKDCISSKTLFVMVESSTSIHINWNCNRKYLIILVIKLKISTCISDAINFKDSNCTYFSPQRWLNG